MGAAASYYSSENNTGCYDTARTYDYLATREGDRLLDDAHLATHEPGGRLLDDAHLATHEPGGRLLDDAHLATRWQTAGWRMEVE